MASRETVRCSHCDLNQFMTKSGKCRRCNEPFGSKHEASGPASAPKAPRVAGVVENLHIVMKVIREAQGMSQRDVARNMGVARTMVSKLERNLVQPRISTLGQISRALNASPFALMAMCEGAAG